MYIQNFSILALFIPIFGVLFVSLSSSQIAARSVAMFASTVTLLMQLGIVLYFTFFLDRTNVINSVLFPHTLKISVQIDSSVVKLSLLTSFMFFMYTATELTVRSVKDYTYSAFLLINEFAILSLLLVESFFWFYFLLIVVVFARFITIGQWGGKKKVNASNVYLYNKVTMLGILLFCMIWLSKRVLVFNLHDFFDQQISLSFVDKISMLVCISIVLMIMMAVFPFHRWFVIASTYSPALDINVLSLSSSVVGSYMMIRLVELFNTDTLHVPYIKYLPLFGIFSMIWSSFMLFKARDIRHFLCYITMYQVSLILSGILSLHPHSKNVVTTLLFAYNISYSGLMAILVAIERRILTHKIASYYNEIGKSPQYSVFFICILLFMLGCIPTTLGYYGLLDVGRIFIENGSVVFSLFIFAIICYSVCIFRTIYQVSLSFQKKERLGIVGFRCSNIEYIMLLIILFSLVGMPTFSNIIKNVFGFII